MTFNIMTLSIKSNLWHSIIDTQYNNTYRYTECDYAAYRILIVVMLSNVMMNVVKLSAIMLNVVMLGVVALKI